MINLTRLTHKIKDTSHRIDALKLECEKHDKIFHMLGKEFTKELCTSAKTHTTEQLETELDSTNKQYDTFYAEYTTNHKELKKLIDEYELIHSTKYTFNTFDTPTIVDDVLDNSQALEELILENLALQSDFEEWKHKSHDTISQASNPLSIYQKYDD